jgi:hypothetical protein
VSASLGASEPAYAVHGTGAVLHAVSRAQGLRASFAASGVTVAAGSSPLGIGLRAIGNARWMPAPAPAAGRATKNRVDYASRGVSEWYANGPLGVEQGFTVASPSAADGAGRLTLSLALSGNLAPTLTAGGHGLDFQRAGKPIMAYRGLAASDARGRSLRAWLVLRNGGVLVRVDARGARYPVRIDPVIQSGTELTPDLETGAGGFGYSVALSGDGNTALIGAPYDNGNGGSATVFDRSGTTWAQVAEFSPSGPDGENGASGFGISVALSADGETALIGGSTDSNGSGAAWIYTQSGGDWTQGQALLPNDEQNSDGQFGYAVALSADGSTALIGAPQEYGQGRGSGAAWIFTASGSTWTQQGSELTPSDQSDYSGRFGSSVALSYDGSTALIGNSTDTGNGGNAAPGAAWVFAASNSTWTQQGSALTPSDENGQGGGSDFGNSVALSYDGHTAPDWRCRRRRRRRRQLLIDGSGVIQSFISGGTSVTGLAVDGSHVLWANQGDGTIGRANLDGSGVIQSFISGGTSVTGLAVDGSHVLWANQGDGTIGRANLDGSSADQSFITGAGSVFGLALTAASPQLTLSAPSITADGRSSTTATMTVADPNGNPVSGDDVTISSSGAQPVGPVTAGSAPGTYRATITSTTSAGSATITATDKSVSPSISETATLTQTPDRAGYVTVALSPGSIIADGSSMSVATATVTDQNDNPVTGDSVAFTSSGAQALGAVTAGASPGTYQATVTATTLAGSATITATDTTVAQHPSGASTLTQTAGPAARVAAALNTPSLIANGSSSTTVTATITDADGNPVSGDTVAFSSSGAQPVGPVTPGSTPGTYQATVTSTKTAGSATITATDTSVTPPITAAGTLTQSAAGALPKPPSQALLQLTGTPRTLLCRSAARPAEPPAMSGS